MPLCCHLGDYHALQVTNVTLLSTYLFIAAAQIELTVQDVRHPVIWELFISFC